MSGQPAVNQHTIDWTSVLYGTVCVAEDVIMVAIDAIWKLMHV